MIKIVLLIVSMDHEQYQRYTRESCLASHRPLEDLKVPQIIAISRHRQARILEINNTFQIVAVFMILADHKNGPLKQLISKS